MSSSHYFGKYRGTVVNNIDPMMIGRIQVIVPDVSGIMLSSWAMPCFPLAGIQAGAYMVPTIGTGVWVEFEQGNPDYPIWVGCWYGTTAEVPALVKAGLPVSPSIVLQTTGQHTFAMSDLPGPTGGLLLKSATGAMIQVNDIGITISNGKGATIVLVGPTVNINAGALTVT